MNSSNNPNLSHRCSPGGGNASIRPYQCAPHWRAAGVPTGTYERGPHYKGYSTLDQRVIKAVSDSIAQIDRLLASGRFTSLVYSYNPDTKLGGHIFNTAQDVRDHIVEQLESVAEKHNIEVIQSEFTGPGRDGDFNRMIEQQPETLFIFNDNEDEFYAHYNDGANPFGSQGLS